eukprot:581981_1
MCGELTTNILILIWQLISIKTKYYDIQSNIFYEIYQIKTIKNNLTQTGLVIGDILHARYPIISIKEGKGGVKIDLSIADEYCEQTTQYILNMIELYTKQFGVPVRPFIIFIKYWSKQCGINDASKGYLNSFGFTLMALKYIQCVTYHNQFIIGSVRNLSCLIFGFFFFYRYSFEHTRHCVDIRNVEYDIEMFEKKRSCALLEIVDPINHSNNVAKNMRQMEYTKMQHQLEKACQIYSDFINKETRSEGELCLFELLTGSSL